MKILSVLMVTLLLAACGATPNTDSLESEAGFRVLSPAEWSELTAGNTLESVEHGSFTYLRDDGAKLIKTKKGDLITREWYLDDNDVTCQTMMSSGELSCLADNEAFAVAFNDSTKAVKLLVNGKITKFILRPGNFANISETQ